MPGRVKVTIDGVEMEAAAGELVIKVAQDHGVYIPRCPSRLSSRAVSSPQM